MRSLKSRRYPGRPAETGEDDEVIGDEENTARREETRTHDAAGAGERALPEERVVHVHRGIQVVPLVPAVRVPHQAVFFSDTPQRREVFSEKTRSNDETGNENDESKQRRIIRHNSTHSRASVASVWSSYRSVSAMCATVIRVSTSRS